MIAVADIEKDEVLARIPKRSLLEPGTCEIKDLLAKSQSLIAVIPAVINIIFHVY
jgi:hypothetical protein